MIKTKLVYKETRGMQEYLMQNYETRKYIPKKVYPKKPSFTNHSRYRFAERFEPYGYSLEELSRDVSR
jgi:hypothetical protein